LHYLFFDFAISLNSRKLATLSYFFNFDTFLDTIHNLREDKVEARFWTPGIFSQTSAYIRFIFFLFYMDMENIKTPEADARHLTEDEKI